MHWAALPGWDDAAHVYKVYLLRSGQSVFWDNYWYGGGYGAITYGVVFYWLAQFIPGKLIVVVAAGTVPVLFYLYQRDMWKIADVCRPGCSPGHGDLSGPRPGPVRARPGAHAGRPRAARARPPAAGPRCRWPSASSPTRWASSSCGVFMLADFIVRPGAAPALPAVLRGARARSVAVRLCWASPSASRAAISTRPRSSWCILGFALAGRRWPASTPRTRADRSSSCSSPTPSSAWCRSSRRAALWATTSGASSSSSACRCCSCCATRGCGGRSVRATLVMILVVMFAVLQFGAAVQPLSHTPWSGRRRRRAFFAPALAAARGSTTRTTASTSSRCAATGRPSTSRRPATPSRAAGTASPTPSTTASSTRSTTPPTTSPGCRAWACGTSSRRWTACWTHGASAR